MRRFSITFLFAAIAVLPVRAQSGADVLPFVSIDRNPVTASLAGGGLSATHGADFSYALFGNPAAVPFMDRHFDLGLNYSMWAPSLQKNHLIQAGGSFKVAKAVALTAGFSRGMYQEMEVSGKSFKPYDMIVGGGISFSIASCVGIGANVKYARQLLLPDNSLYGVSMDAFVQYHNEDFNIMAGVGNFGPAVRSTGVNDKYKLNPVFHFGIDYVFTPGDFSLQPVMDVAVYFDKHWAGDIGLQAGWKEMVWLRAGYRYASKGTVIPSHLSLGLGASFYGVRIHAAWLTLNKEIGNTFLIGLGYGF